MRFGFGTYSGYSHRYCLKYSRWHCGEPDHVTNPNRIACLISRTNPNPQGLASLEILEPLSDEVNPTFVQFCKASILKGATTIYEAELASSMKAQGLTRAKQIGEFAKAWRSRVGSEDASKHVHPALWALAKP
jgi:hypothetical protein